MISKFMKMSCTIVTFVLVLALSIPAVSATEHSGPAPLAPQLSSDGNTLYNATPVVAVMADPYPPAGQVCLPPRFDVSTLPETATANFSITYVPNGGKDPWNAACVTFPEEAKAAFNAAGAIWGNLLRSSVPITISACWSNLGSSTILGYSGGGTSHRNFTGAPLTNTWYTGSLANALAGSDLDPSNSDMHITYNSNFTWHYGTDGLPPAGTYDLMSVVLHEIGHGLNFLGWMSYSGGTGSWGGGTGYPGIYDTFMRDGSGNLLIDTGTYANPSAALGSALTSNNVWFNGANAMAANGGQQVKIYAPSTWSSGSSYSHLDYNTFKGGVNRLMVYAISSGVATHDPGPVTLGLLKDLGWPSGVPTEISTLLWSGSNGSASIWTLDASGNMTTYNLYGPFTGWTATSYHRNSDGTAQMLWVRTDGFVTIQNYDTSGNPTTYMPYGPYTGWTAKSYHRNGDGTAQMLWVRTDGLVSLQNYDTSGNPTTYMPYGPYTGWTATCYHLNSDGTGNMLWVRTDGLVSLWTINTSGMMTGAMLYGPYSGWTARSYRRNSDGTGRMLWVRTDGLVSLWNMDTGGNMTSYKLYGPYSGWAAQDYD